MAPQASGERPGRDGSQERRVALLPTVGYLYRPRDGQTTVGNREGAHPDASVGSSRVSGA